MKNSFSTKKRIISGLLAALLLVGLVFNNLSPLRAGADDIPDASATPVPSEGTDASPVPTGETNPTPSPAETDVTPTAEPGNDATPTPGENPLIAQYAAGTYENCTASFFIADYPETARFGFDEEHLLTVSRINEWAFVLAILAKTEYPTDEPDSKAALVNCDNNVTVSKNVLDAAGKVKSPVLLGLKAQDTLRVRDLIDMYIVTLADDVREVLVSYFFGSETNAVNEMNRIAAGLKMKNTRYSSSNSDFNDKNSTTVSDVYLLFRELLRYDSFLSKTQLESITVPVTRAGKTEDILCEKVLGDDVLLYGAATVPMGFKLVTHISGADAKSGGVQAALVNDFFGNSYIYVIGNVPFEKDVSIEMSRLIELRGAYEDADQELPLGDDTIRYKYLLDSEVEYYTMDNLPRGYSSAAEADKYMMELEATVWQLNERTGTYYEAVMKVSINRKLYSGLKAIVEEIHGLPEHFPFKIFIGYGYRKSGGVGLSNCTLLSTHAYGAAVDINNGDYDNDYFLGKGNDLRNKSNPYCIPDEVIEIFAKHGWYWGGNYNICADTMHFQYLGLDHLSYQDNDPFVNLTTKGIMDVGKIVFDAQRRLKEIGYSVNQNGIYNNKTRTAVMKFQSENGLPITGEIDYKTWETLINLTHYMEYYF